jgi:hypothetical protein
MLKSLLDSRDLKGLSKVQVEQLLGESDPNLMRSNPPDFAYCVGGDGDGHLDYLVLYLDSEKARVERVEVIRN